MYHDWFGYEFGWWIWHEHGSYGRLHHHDGWSVVAAAALGVLASKGSAHCFGVCVWCLVYVGGVVLKSANPWRGLRSKSISVVGKQFVSSMCGEWGWTVAVGFESSYMPSFDGVLLLCAISLL